MGVSCLCLQWVLRCQRGRYLFIPLEQPDFVALQHVRDPGSQLGTRFSVSVDDFAEQRIVNIQHFGQAVLANATLPKLQLQIRIHARARSISPLYRATMARRRWHRAQWPPIATTGTPRLPVESGFLP